MTGPAEVVRHYLDLVGQGRWDELADLYAEDAVVVHPLEAPGRQRLAGRTALKQHFAFLAGLDLQMQAVDLVVHETTAEEVVVAEFGYVGTQRGRPFERRNVFAVTVRDGQIASSRDYTAEVA